jgi:uncharacterized membrane protein YjgN (DUF898 family)
MSDPLFEVVLKGVLPGFGAEQAQNDFSALFSLDAEKTAGLFATQNAVLKSRISQADAERYVKRLAAIGVHAAAESLVVEEAVAAEEAISVEETIVDQEAVAVEEPLTLEPVFEQEAHPDDITIRSEVNSTVKDEPKIERHAFVFNGNGVEYFKIWIVNILLSLVTIGIYSAWAKVRNKQYFYGNTRIADNTFEYTADPIKILKGRVIAVALYAGLAFANHISMTAYLIATVLFLICLPVIILNSLKFNARHSSYRNIAFRFDGTLGGALKVFILWPIAGILTFGILMPFAWKRQAQYITNNHSYGGEAFKFDVDVKEYFIMLMILMAICFGFFIVLFALIGGAAAVGIKSGGNFDPQSMLFIVPIVIGYIGFYLLVGAYLIATMANIHWNNTRLQKHQFAANWGVLSYLGLLFTNTLGILVTLGLFIPFAKVRAAQYKANHMAFIAAGDLDNFIAGNLAQSNSLAEGVHDIFDIDISI